MTHIVIVGDRESGKTTFLALLYAAQVKSGSGTSDAFRFHAAIESLDEISDAFQQLMSGSFPDSATKEGIRGITFHLGYRKAGLGVLTRLLSRGWTPGASASLHFILVRNLEEEMALFHRGSSLANAALRDVLESDAVVIIVDSSKLGVTDETRQLGLMGRYDAAVESLLTALQRLRISGKGKALHPIFVFSKFDSVDPAALRAAQVEGEPPEIRRAGPRAAYAEALLNYNLPRTMARVRNREPQRLPFAKSSFFFSSVRAEPATADRKAKVRLRTSRGVGWEPDYSTDEYLGLLERFWRIATIARE